MIALLETVFFAASLAGLVLATYTDLKSREIPDKLTYALIAFGLAGHFFLAVSGNDYMLFVQALAVTVLSFLGAYALWHVGVWAGGDVKLFAALAALNPVNYGFIRDAFSLDALLWPGKPELFASLSLPVFPLALFVFSVFSMMPYGVLLSLMGFYKSALLRQQFLSGFVKRGWQLLQFSLLGVGLLAVTYALGLPEASVWPLLLALSFLPSLVVLAFTLASFAYASYVYYLIPFFEAMKYFAPLLLFYVFFKLYLVSKEEVLKQRVPTASLVEGMIPAETIVESVAGKLVVVKPLRPSEILSFARRLDFRGLQARMVLPEGGIVANSVRAAGLTDEEARKLRELAARKLLPETIKVKRSAPFVPAVLIAYLVLQSVGDVLWRVVFR